MKLLVTGASGFLGRHIVSEALARNHKVRAMFRPTSDLAGIEWLEHPNLEIVRHDLRSKRQLVDQIEGVDAVVHAAAAKSGDFYSQFAGTVVATENLLSAMTKARVSHIVAISSFAVYDYHGRWSHAKLTEKSPLTPAPEVRDAYCQTKLLQEQMIIEYAKKQQWKYTVLRPGAIYGRDHLWTHRLGRDGTRWWLRFGAWAAVPLAYVENCAEAIVLAAERAEADGQTFNIVDDNPPTQRRYLKELQRRTVPRPKILPVSWTLLRITARCAWLTNKILFKGRAKMPALFIPVSLHAAAKPLRYPNDHLKNTIGWTCRYSRAEALERSLAG